MPRACRIVDSSGVVHNVIVIKIVVNGIVRTVESALVSQGGVARQYWPEAAVVTRDSP